MKLPRRLNLNYVGLFLVVGAYLVSVYAIYFDGDDPTTSIDPIAMANVETPPAEPIREDQEPVAPVERRDMGEDRIVRFLHWQLEPGFREAMDAVIADYNALPRVRAAGYKVEQMAISEKVYSQFVNVHLISGTAPDLVCLGKSVIASNVSKYFDPLGSYLEEPNPYNADKYLPADMDPELRSMLQGVPWRETFLDGLSSQAFSQLGNNYSIPVAAWGTVRLYYNTVIAAQVKALLREALASPALPAWFQETLVSSNNPDGIIPLDDALRAWIASDELPDTLGRLILFAEGVQVLAQQTGNEKLVPIAGSSYSIDNFAKIYGAAFTYQYERALDRDMNSFVDALESLVGWEEDLWDFSDPPVEASYEVLRKIATYFPPGFIGLDREQANRRFILGNAAMLATGAWDAAGIFQAAEARKGTDDEIGIAIATFPVPGPGERWYEYDPVPVGESGGMNGIPMALYKFSTKKPEAIDFMRYLTAYTGNQKLIQLAGWIPVTIGSEPIDRMKPFLPDREGVQSSVRINFDRAGNISTVYNGQLLLYIGGDLTYDQFAENLSEAFRDERNGIDRRWFEQYRSSREINRSTERGLTVVRPRIGGEDADPLLQKAFPGILLESSRRLSGREVLLEWEELYPGQAFPIY